eukprot:5275845-Pyramimonas_sp.AAC.1
MWHPNDWGGAATSKPRSSRSRASRPPEASAGSRRRPSGGVPSSGCASPWAFPGVPGSSRTAA